MAQEIRPLAIVTGASAGIGHELARICAENGFDLVIAADQPKIQEAARDLRALGAAVEAVEADLATLEGVDRLYAATGGRPVEALLANAGHGLRSDLSAPAELPSFRVPGTQCLHLIAQPSAGSSGCLAAARCSPALNTARAVVRHRRIGADDACTKAGCQRFSRRCFCLLTGSLERCAVLYTVQTHLAAEVVKIKN